MNTFNLIMNFIYYDDIHTTLTLIFKCVNNILLLCLVVMLYRYCGKGIIWFFFFYRLTVFKLLTIKLLGFPPSVVNIIIYKDK